MNVRNKGKQCQAPNCPRDAVCKGFCHRHYQQIRLKGKLQEKEYMYIDGICRNLGCGKKVFAKGFCRQCYMKQREGHG